jgi:hypothetical protein
MASKQRSFLGIIYYTNDDSMPPDEEGGRRRTTVSSWIVLTSWLVSVALVGASLFASPHLRSVIGQPGGGLAGPLAAFLIVSVLCGWPWLLAFIAADSSERQVSAVAFAFVSVVIAVYTAVSVSSAPSEGVVYSVVFGIFLVWLAYPVLRFLGGK